MKKVKKILALMLTLAMCLTSMPGTAFALTTNEEAVEVIEDVQEESKEAATGNEEFVDKENDNNEQPASSVDGAEDNVEIADDNKENIAAATRGNVSLSEEDEENVPTEILASAGEEAQVEEVSYETLAEAFAAADGKTVTLLKDVELASQIVVSGNVVLELAGHTINSDVDDTFLVSSDAVFTLQDTAGNGKIVTNAYTVVNNSGTFVLLSGQLESGVTTAGANTVYNNGGTVEISGGSVTAKGRSGSYAVSTEGDGLITITDNAVIYAEATGTSNGAIGVYAVGGTVNISGGMISVKGANSAGIMCYNNVSVNVTGGTVTAEGKETAALLNLGNSSVSISGGTIQTTGEDMTAAVYNQGNGTVAITGDAQIQAADNESSVALMTDGGTVEVTNGEEGKVPSISGSISSNSEEPAIIIEGGIFDERAQESIEENAVRIIAYIGEKGYASLADAIAAASEGNTITLVEGELSIPATVSIPKNVTIQGAGKDKTTVVIETSTGSGMTLSKEGITLRDMKIDGRNITSGDYKTLVNVVADGCRIENVIMTGGGTSTWNSSILVEQIPDTATFTVKDSKVSGAFRGVLRESCSGNIVIDNCDIDAVYPFNIDGGAGGVITVIGSRLHGWTSYSCVEKVVFTECEFSKGNSGYNVVAAYVDTEFEECEFTAGGEDKTFGVYAQRPGFTFTFNECTKDRIEVSAENLSDCFEDSDVWKKCETAIDVVTDDNGAYTKGTIVSTVPPVCADGSVALKTGMSADGIASVFRIGSRVEKSGLTCVSAGEDAAKYTLGFTLYAPDDSVVYQKGNQEVILTAADGLSMTNLGGMAAVVADALDYVGAMATDAATITLSLDVDSSDAENGVFNISLNGSVLNEEGEYLSAVAAPSTTAAEFAVANSSLSGELGFELDVTAMNLSDSIKQVTVKHTSEGYEEENFIAPVRNNKVPITVSHCSTLTVKKLVVEGKAVNGRTAVQYETLQEAVDEAQDGDVITLLDDVTEDVYIDKELTLNLADKTLTGAEDYAIYTDAVLKVTADENGKVIAPQNGNAVYLGGGELILADEELSVVGSFSLDDGAILITAGSFSEDPSEYVQTGYTVVGSNPYVVTKLYTITYYDGEDVMDLSPASYTKLEPVTLPSSVSAPEHYTFAGWYKKKALTGNPVEILPVGTSGDKVFYIKWKADEHTISFYLNGGKIGDSEEDFTRIAEYNTRVVKPTDPTKVGNTFLGWFTSSEIFEDENKYDFETLVTGNLSLYAGWTKKPVKVTYKDGEDVYAEQNYLYGDAAERPETDPAKENFGFIGWFTSNETFDETTAYDFTQSNLTEDVVLYAGWAPAIASLTHGEDVLYAADVTELFDAAQSGDTITLLSDVETTAVLSVAANLTLDLGAYKLSGSNTQTLAVSGDLSVKGTGTIENTKNKANARAIQINNGGSVTFDETSDVTVKGAALTIITVNGALNISGGKFTGKFNGSGSFNITGGYFADNMKGPEEGYYYAEDDTVDGCNYKVLFAKAAATDGAGVTRMYTSFEEALASIYKNGGTVELFADETYDNWYTNVNKWHDGRTGGSGVGQSDENNGAVTILGNGHTLTFNNATNPNGKIVLFKTKELNVRDLTVVLGSGLTAFYPESGSFENVVFQNGQYGMVYRWATDSIKVDECQFNDQTVNAIDTLYATNAEITNSTFTNTAIGVFGTFEKFSGNTVVNTTVEVGTGFVTDFTRNDFSGADKIIINVSPDEQYATLNGNYWGEEPNLVVKNGNDNVEIYNVYTSDTFEETDDIVAKLTIPTEEEKYTGTETFFTSLADAAAQATDGSTITVIESDWSDPIVVDADVTLEMYSHEIIYGQITVTNGKTLAIKGTGAISRYPQKENGGKLEIYGCYYNTKVDEDDCAEGYIPTNYPVPVGTNYYWAVENGTIVARIGSAGYKSLSEALGAVRQTGGEATIKILDDITEYLDVTDIDTHIIFTADKPVTVHALNSNTDNRLYFRNGATFEQNVIWESNGDASNNYAGFVTQFEGDTYINGETHFRIFRIVGKDVKATVSTTGKLYCDTEVLICVYDGATLEVNGTGSDMEEEQIHGTIKIDNDSMEARTNTVILNDTFANLNQITVKPKSGTDNNVDDALQFSATNSRIVVHQGVVNFGDSTETTVTLANSTLNQTTDKGIVLASGQTLNMDTSSSIMTTSWTNNGTVNVDVTGLEQSELPYTIVTATAEDPVVPGMISLTNNTNNYLTAVDGNMIQIVASVASVEIGSTVTYYKTFEEALAALPTDGTESTLTLFADVLLNDRIWLPSNVTLDGQGYSIKPADVNAFNNEKLITDSSYAARSGLTLINLADNVTGVTIKNVTIDSNNLYPRALIGTGKGTSITLENVVLNHTSSTIRGGDAVALNGDCTVKGTLSVALGEKSWSAFSFNTTDEKLEMSECESFTITSDKRIGTQPVIIAYFEGSEVDIPASLGMVPVEGEDVETGYEPVTSDKIGSADSEGTIYNYKVTASDGSEKYFTTFAGAAEEAVADVGDATIENYKDLAATDIFVLTYDNKLYVVENGHESNVTTTGAYVVEKAAVDNVTTYSLKAAVASIADGTAITYYGTFEEAAVAALAADTLPTIELLADAGEYVLAKDKELKVEKHDWELTVKSSDETAYVIVSTLENDVTTFATQAPVASITVGAETSFFATLAEAIDAAAANDTIVVLDDLNLGSTLVTIKKDFAITLDLNGHEIETDSFIKLEKGNLTIISTGNQGVIFTEENEYGPVVISFNEEPVEKRTLTIASNVILQGINCGLFIEGTTDDKANNIEVNIDGTINGMVYVPYYLSNTQNQIAVNVRKGALIQNNNNAGIGIEGYAVITVEDGAKVVGSIAGIVLSNGKLIVTGGTIQSAENDGIFVVPSKKDNILDISISGGTISGDTALYVSDAYGEDNEKTTVSVTGGTFTGTERAVDVHYRMRDTVNKFITGGLFSDADVYADGNCAEGYYAKASGDLYEVVRCTEHVDTNPADGLCDNCGHRLASLVTVTSSGDGTADGTSVAFASGGGVYEANSSVTVKVNKASGYEFVGWYKKSGEKIDGATELTYTFTADGESDYDLVAVFKPVSDGTFRLSITGSKFTVQGTGLPKATQRAYLDGNYNANQSITLTFTGSENFLYWINSSDKIVSKSPTYTFSLVQNTTLRAVYSETSDTEALVVFVSAKNNGQVMSSFYCAVGDEILFPSAPASMGKVFKFWSLDGENAATDETIYAAIPESGGKLELYPVYESDGRTYTVTINFVDKNGEALADPDNTTYANIEVGNGTTIVAAEEINGTSFAYWKNPSGDILSYTNSYFVRPTTNIEIYAVYDVESEAQPVIMMTEAYAAQEGAYYKVSFTASRSIPEGYTLVGTGIIYARAEYLNTASEEDIRRDMVLQSANTNVKYLNASGTGLNDTYTGNILTSAADREFYAVGYMIVKNSQNDTITLYSDNFLHGSYNTLNNLV